MPLIGLLAQKHCGKGTVAGMLAGYGFTEVAFADPLKDICGTLFGFSDEQLRGGEKELVDNFWGFSPREAFQFLGTDVFRNEIHKLNPSIGQDFWIKRLERTIVENPDTNYVISDVRFQNEVDMIRRHSGLVVKIIREDACKDLSHESETGVESIVDYDDVLFNDSTIDDLSDDVNLLVCRWGLNKPISSKMIYSQFFGST